jgi:hypothetical protein
VHQFVHIINDPFYQSAYSLSIHLFSVPLVVYLLHAQLDLSVTYKNYRNFQRMNDRILGKLTDISRSSSRELRRDDVKQLGLDPVGDYEFLEQLIDLYSFDVELEALGFSTCCPELC